MVHIKNALANIKASKLRVFSAMIWIVLGITSVVIVASVGNGLEAKIGEVSDTADKRTVTIEFCPTFGDEGNMLQPFSQRDIERISLMDGVERVDTSGDNNQMNTALYTSIEKEGMESSIVLKDFEKAGSLDIKYGRDFGYEDENRRTLVLSYKVAEQLFGNPFNAVGETIDIDNGIFEIVGVTSEDFTSGDEEYDSFNDCFAPKSSIPMHRGDSSFGLTSIEVVISPGYNVMETGHAISEELTFLNGGDSGFYSAYNDNNELKGLQDLQSIISEFTSILTVISLLIGGIGIMNIMFMSVMERQREIGVRRAIGAKPKNILTQFLIESVVITSLGGIIGIVVAIITSVVMSNVLPFRLVPTITSYFYAVGASVLIGIIFGVVPAIKASRIDPIKAIQG